MTSISNDTSTRLDWYVRQGDRSELLVTITKDSDGTAYDLSGFTFTCTVKKNGVTVISPTVTSGGVNGLVNISLTASQTNSLAADEYFWEVKISNPISLYSLMINGIFVVNGFIWDSENTNKTKQIEDFLM